MATFNTELARKGPVLLLRDITRGDDPQIAAVVEVLVATAPDIVALQGFDYDLTGEALRAFAAALAEAGLDYPHVFAARPNTGLHTGLDMDGNGRLAEARDAQGYGYFSGQGGMAVMSRYPIVTNEVQDFSSLLWKDMPDPMLPERGGAAFPSDKVQAIQRLSTTAHWVVPVEVPGIGRVSLLTFHASPPVFDGVEDLNGRRNHDEIIFWRHFLDGVFGASPQESFVLLGDANQDPRAGEGIKDAIGWLLTDERMQDARPRGDGSAMATGDPFDTADWDTPRPGNLRVDYVLPSKDWIIVDAGVYWPTGPEGETVARASRHRLVWVDLER